jgi:hypothetical protein
LTSLLGLTIGEKDQQLNEDQLMASSTIHKAHGNDTNQRVPAAAAPAALPPMLHAPLHRHPVVRHGRLPVRRARVQEVEGGQ